MVRIKSKNEHILGARAFKLKNPDKSGGVRWVRKRWNHTSRKVDPVSINKMKFKLNYSIFNER